MFLFRSIAVLHSILRRCESKQEWKTQWFARAIVAGSFAVVPCASIAFAENQDGQGWFELSLLFALT